MNEMNEIDEIKKELREDCGNPFYKVTREIVNPMVKRINCAKYDGLKFPEEYPEPFNYGEAFDLSWHWGLMMQREYEIRPLLAECRELMA